MSRPVGIRNSFPVGNNLTRWLARKGWSPWYILWCQSLDCEPASRVVLDPILLGSSHVRSGGASLSPIVTRAALEIDEARFLCPVITTSEWRSSFADRKQGL